MKILDFNHCDLGCDCGWNVQIGGESAEELADLKTFLGDIEDVTDYKEKMNKLKFINEKRNSKTPSVQ